MTSLDLAQIERDLRAREADLVAQIDEMTKPPTDMSNISFGKRVGDGTQMAVDRIVAVGVHEQLTAILDEVRHALQRLEDGTYGICEVCGDPIPDGRLEARPWAARCVQHA